jgi:asparagine N-glycosylation enzyme membrane subunit Stt3
MPVAILCGYLGGTLICMIPDSLPRIRAVVAVGAVLLLSLVGARNALTIADPSYILVTVPDLKAMRWIEDHTPEGARFLANSFFTYEDNVLVGSDAGWWIPLLAHRQNTVPPITYGHERAAEPDYIAQVNELGHLVQDSALDAPQTIQLLKSRGISHVYIGSMGGSLSAETLLVSEAYTPVYHEDRVWVFALP